MSLSWKLAQAFINGFSDAFESGFAGGGKKKGRRNVGIYDLESEMSKKWPDTSGDPWDNPFKSKQKKAYNPFSWWKL